MTGSHVAPGEAEHGAPLLVRVRDGVHLGPRPVDLRVQRPRFDAPRITLARLHDVAVEVDEHEVVRLDALQADGGRRADEDEVRVRHARADVALVCAEAVVVQQAIRQRHLLAQRLQLSVVRHGADATTGRMRGQRRGCTGGVVMLSVAEASLRRGPGERGVCPRDFSAPLRSARNDKGWGVLRFARDDIQIVMLSGAGGAVEASLRERIRGCGVAREISRLRSK